MNQSIVLCRPVTGRKHQIRVHLGKLSIPIANDSIYNTSPVPETHKESTIFIPKNLHYEKDPLCDYCNVPTPQHKTGWQIWLHAYHYCFENSSEETNLTRCTSTIPSWALDPLFTPALTIELIQPLLLTPPQLEIDNKTVE